MTNFINVSGCVVFPLGEYDNDLMWPTMEWVQKMMKEKIDRINRINASRQSFKSINSSSTTSKTSLRQLNEAKPLSGSMQMTTTMSGRTSFDTDNFSLYSNSLVSKKNEFDPFRRSGVPFGSLIREIKHRYCKYLSDITDAFNLTCLISFILMFTICAVPCVCFGAILGIEFLVIRVPVIYIAHC
jgi:hypothetical protein